MTDPIGVDNNYLVEAIQLHCRMFDGVLERGAVSCRESRETDTRAVRRTLSLFHVDHLRMHVNHLFFRDEDEEVDGRAYLPWIERFDARASET